MTGSPEPPGSSRPAEAPPDDHAPGLERLFDRVPEEAAYALDAVEGELPAWVRGTCYWNGPGRFRRGDVEYDHWLDGDGMIAALALDGAAAGVGRARFANRFVRSAKLAEEEAAGRALYRAFGTAFPDDRLVRGIALASPVNVSIYPFAGTLLAFGEQGLPYAIDPGSLETAGEHTFGRRINPISPFAAHPAFDPESGEMVNFGVSFSSSDPVLNLYTFAADGTLARRTRTRLEHPYSVHDFGLSPRYAVFYLGPYLLEIERLAEGGTLLDALVWRPELGSELLVLSRETGEEVARVPTGERYCVHQVNAYEVGDHLVVDLIEKVEPVYADYRPLRQLFAEVAAVKPVRYEIALGPGRRGGGAGRLVERREIGYPLAADFPVVDPRLQGRSTERFWALAIAATGRPGRKFFDRLQAIDWEEPPGQGGVADEWQAPAGRYLAGEPCFLGQPGAPGRGAIVVPELDPLERRAAYLVFDAHALAAGPVARLPLRAAIPPLFHSCWVEAG